MVQGGRLVDIAVHPDDPYTFWVAYASGGLWKTTNNVLVVLANDSNGDGTIVPSSVAIVTNPTSGSTAVPAGDGTILYTPRNGYKGTDFFTYEVCDDLGSCAEAEVLVNVVK